MSNAAFFEAMAPYAESVASATGLRTGVILTLMGEETGFGASPLAHQNNMTGIMWTPRAAALGAVKVAGGFASYRTLGDWATDMIATLEQPNMAVILASAGQDPSHQFTAIGESPYDGDTYANRMLWADRLMAIYTEQGLAAYDGGGSTPTPPSTPGAPALSTFEPQISGTLGGQVIIDTATKGQLTDAAAALVIIGALVAWANK